jgi:predicted dehydrogenase
MAAARARVLVCGGGSIGRRHIANLAALGAEVSVWRARAHLVDALAAELGARAYTDVDAAIAEADAVVVATATDQHVPLALKTLERGRALFIEKPLSHDRTGIDELQRFARGRVVEVGCQYRAHPNLIALARELGNRDNGRALTYRLVLGHRLDAWRTSDYRECYSADAARGGGALFDLIHMIDVALWLFGTVVDVDATLAQLSDLDLACDDVANVLLTHASGVTGHVQLDMASPVHRCAAEVVTTRAVYRWSNAKGAVTRESAEGAAVVDRMPQGSERNDLFLTHMKHFLSRLDAPQAPALCSLTDGVAALDVALAARAANATRCRASLQAGI